MVEVYARLDISYKVGHAWVVYGTAAVLSARARAGDPDASERTVQ